MITKSLLVAAALLLAAMQTTTRAAGLTASDGAASDNFGYSVSESGNTGLVGAYHAKVGSNSQQGAAYVFRNLDTATGTVTQNVKLTASDGAAGNFFGYSVSESGNTGLIGAYGARTGGHTNQGAAYVFRNLDTATGTVTQNVKLTASDGAANDDFGWSAGLSGTTGLVGAYNATVGSNLNQGAAYVFRNLDTATGTVTQNVKLTASDGAATNFFGYSVSESGNTGLVGAYRATVGSTLQGAAYVFRNLNTATGTVTQNVKLTASDGAVGDNFGYSVSESGNTGLVGAYLAKVGSNSQQGAAYVFRNLDTATGTVTQNVKLTASDGVASDRFANSVSESGNTGLVGAYLAKVGSNSQQGAAYVFRNLDTATGTVTQNVKLTASDGAASDNFGYSVSLDGDQFVIGATGKNSNTGKAYTGSISSVTMLDVGNTSKVTGSISFVSQDDWIVGQTTSGNQVTLGAGDSANVTASGKGVFLGRNAGSNNNTLIVRGNLVANLVNIGSTAGNTGNVFQFDSTATFGPVTLELATGNQFKIQGDYSNIDNLLAYLGSSTLQTWNNGAWITVNAGNAFSLITDTYSAGSGYSTIQAIQAVPEPSTYAMLGIGGAGLLALSRRKRV